MNMLFLAALLLAQTHLGSPADSVAEHRRAVDAQAAFERNRAWHAPFSWWSGGGECDERVGRFCLRFGSDDPDEDRPRWTPPDEVEEVIQARREFLALLAGVGERYPGNAWVAGQRVAYLGEQDRWDEALRVARTCTATGWWCDGLEGYALHGAGRIAEAERSFERVSDRLDPDEREEWDNPEILGSMELMREARRMDTGERAAFRERLWALGNPLFMIQGNALRTEHQARWVLSQIRAEARNGHGLPWGSDLAELLLRFGPIVAYERVRESGLYTSPAPVIGRYPPESWHLVPSVEAVLDPPASDSAHWRTDRRQARSRHAPPPAPRIRAMEAQTARFRRGNDLLLVAAWALAPLPGDSAREGFEPGIFLLSDTGSVPVRHETLLHHEEGGISLARVPAGRYLLSLEALDSEHRRAWRHREGVSLDPDPVGVFLVSDLLLFEPREEGSAGTGTAAGTAVGTGAGTDGGEPPALDELMRLALPRTSIEPGPIGVAWEVYGLPAEALRLRYRIRAEREDRGLLRRAGEALRLLSPPAPIELRWEEGVPAAASPAREPLLRSVGLDLSGLEPGTYRLTLAVSPPGYTDATASRLIRIPDQPPD
jgi:hypothetical protein